jgi:hypothetical protein
LLKFFAKIRFFPYKKETGFSTGAFTFGEGFAVQIVASTHSVGMNRSVEKKIVPVIVGIP